jgi:hypothetical protein
VYPCAALLFLLLLGAIPVAVQKTSGAAEAIALTVFVLMCFVFPVALLRLGRRSGVHVSEAGVVSVGNRYADVIRWEDVDRFDTRENHGDGSVVVYALLADGSEVVLSPLRGRLWTRPRLRRIGAELQARLLEERVKAQTRPGPPPPFTAIPRGWRRRDHQVERTAAQPGPTAHSG